MKAAANGVLNLSTLDGWWAEAWRADDETGLVHRDNAQPPQDFRMVGDLLLAHCDPLAEKAQIAVHPAGHLFAQGQGAGRCVRLVFLAQVGLGLRATPQTPRPLHLPWPVYTFDSP